MSKKLSLPEGTDVAIRREDGFTAANRYSQNSRSNSTWRTYSSAWLLFEQYCTSVDLPALPAAPETVAMFIAEQADAGFATSTLEHRLAAIRLMHLGKGFSSPHNTLQVMEVLRGIRRHRKAAQPDKKLPVMDTQIKAMIDKLDLSTRRGLRDRALLLYGFAGAFRRSELVALDVEHISAHEKGDIVTIAYSKGDQEGQGQRVGVLAQPASAYCPVTAMQMWLREAGIKKGAVFRRFYRSDKLSDKRLSDKSVALLVKQSIVAIGLREDEHRYSGHSLRRGFLTSAGRQGVDLLKLIEQSRHTRVDTVLGYIDDHERFENHAAEGLLKGDD